MRLLVTGGAGYIGGFVTRLLQDNGHDVVVVDDLSTGHPKAVGNATLVAIDVGDPEAMRQLLRDRSIKAVLHLAGVKSVAESWTQPWRYLDINVGKTIKLLSAMADAGVTNLVYSSSCSVYGDGAQSPIDEEQEPLPISPYARTKLLAEQAIACAAEDGKLRYVTLRYFNAAGAEFDGSAGESLDASVNLIPMVMKAALGIMPHVSINGTDYPTADGTAVRDYIHVADLAEAHSRSLDYLLAGGRSVTLNVGTGTGASVRQIHAAVERVSGGRISVVQRERRPGDPAAVWANTGLAHRTLGWHSRLGIDEIVDSAWRWHSSHPRGFD